MQGHDVLHQVQVHWEDGRREVALQQVCDDTHTAPPGVRQLADLQLLDLVGGLLPQGLATVQNSERANRLSV